MQRTIERLIRPPAGVLLLLVAVLGALFWKSFLPGWIHFSNDGPLGVLNAEWIQLPGSMLAAWNDLNSIGIKTGACPPTFTTFFRWVAGPVGYSKFLAPFTLLVLGLAAWWCFRRLELAAGACVIGTVAAVLNADTFSTACWGVASQIITFAMAFVAVGMVLSNRPEHPRWLRGVRLAIAGCAVGIGVIEGADIGAIFSLFVAAFVVFHTLSSRRPEPLLKRWGLASASVALVALCAAGTAAHTLYTLVTSQIKGVAMFTKPTEDDLRRWDWATQWSLPKTETLGLLIPGLFGYRMDTPNGGMYWGAMGRDPNWDRYFAGQLTEPPPGFLRYSGGGNYLGCVVWLGAIWAIGRALRRKPGGFPDPYLRRFILFWAGVAFISLLLAYGRHAPFYVLFYSLPYFSTIRNPCKFLHIFTWAMLFLSTCGYSDLIRNYVIAGVRDDMGKPGATRPELKLTGPELSWALLYGALAACVVLGFMIYASFSPDLVAYLQSVRAQFDQQTARQIAAFSKQQFLWFVGFFLLTAGTLVLVLARYFTGRRAPLFTIAMLVLVTGELGRADRYWTVFWYYPDKYALDPVVEFLRKKPYEGRVAICPFPAPPDQTLLRNYYGIEWAQHQFQYYNIQSIDIVQMPRMPQDLQEFEMALAFTGSAGDLYKFARRWALTNTRYLLASSLTRLPMGDLDTIEFLNKWVAGDSNAFRAVLRFELVPKPGVTRPTRFDQFTAIEHTNGRYMLLEFTRALPRAGMFTSWTVITNDQEVLRQLVSPEFDPHRLVLVSDPIPPATETNRSGSEPTVKFESYRSRHIALKTGADSPCLLLLNDKFDPDWTVTVDAQPAKLLRCNFIMRGVFLPPGEHRVEFSYRPTAVPFYISLVWGLAALGLTAMMIIGERKEPAPISARTSEPAATGKPTK